MDWSQFEAVDSPSDAPSADADWSNFEVVEPANPRKELPEGVTPNETGGRSASMADPRRLDTKPPAEPSFIDTVKDNLVYGAKLLGNSLPGGAPLVRMFTPQAENPANKSVLDNQPVVVGSTSPNDMAENERLSRRDYAEQVDQQARIANSPNMREPVAATGTQAYADQNPVRAAFKSDAARTLAGTLNAPAVALGVGVEAINKKSTDAGGPEIFGRVPNVPLVDDLRKVSQEYTSTLSRKSPGQAWDEGDFGRWMMTQMAGNSQSAAQSLAALFAPGAQAVILGSMGATAAGSAYAEGDSAGAATLKGLVEVGSEKLPLHAAEKLKDLVLTIPSGSRNLVLAEAGKRLPAAGTAITANSLVGAIEESAAEIGGNAIDKYVSGKNKSLFEDVDRAAIVGAAFGGGMSAPALAGLASPASNRASEFARAMNEGTLPAAGLTVDEALRTSGNTLAPEATSISAAQAAAARQLEARALSEQATTAVEEIQAKAVSDIGKATSVDEAIASAQTAVSLDGKAMVDEALQAAGVDTADLNAVATQTSAETAAAVREQAAAEIATEAAEVAQKAEATQTAQVAEAPTTPATQAGETTEPVKTWFGRRGDGYTTTEDAARGLKERERLAPDLDWTIEPTPDGKYRLAGYAQTTAKTFPTWDTMSDPNQPITLYRGESSANEAGGQWWTTDRAKAERYGNVTEITLPASVVASNAARGHNRVDEFVFPDKRPADLLATPVANPLANEILQAEQQLDAQVQRRASGTLAITGPRAPAIRAQLAQAGIPSVPINGGIEVGRANAARAEAMVSQSSVVPATMPVPQTPAGRAQTLPAVAPRQEATRVPESAAQAPGPTPAAAGTQASAVTAGTAQPAVAAGVPAARAGASQAASVTPAATPVSAPAQESAPDLTKAKPDRLLYLSKNPTSPLQEAAKQELRRREVDAAYRQREAGRPAEEQAIVEEARDQQAAQETARSVAQESDAPSAMQVAMEKARAKREGREPGVKFSIDGAQTQAQNSTDEPSRSTADTGQRTVASRSPGTSEQQRIADDIAQRVSARLGRTLVLDVVAPGRGESSARNKEESATVLTAKRLFGQNVIFVRQSERVFHGLMSDAYPNTVFIDIDTDKPMMAVLGHELLHQLRKNQPGIYRQLDDRLTALLKNPGEFLDRIEAQYRAKGMEIPQNWDEELFADVVGDNFTDPEFWKAMAESQPRLFQRVANAIRQFLNNVLLKAKPFGTDQFMSDVKAARDAVVDAMRQFSGAEVGAMTDQMDGIALSVADSGSKNQTNTSITRGKETTAKAMKRPMPQASQSLRKMADQIKQVIEQDEDGSDFALRVIPDGSTAKTGDTLAPSRQWVDGAATTDELAGTSGIGVSAANVERAIRDLQRGGYPGGQIVLMRGERAGSGEDVGEVLLRNAEVVATFGQDNAGIRFSLPTTQSAWEVPPDTRTDKIVYELADGRVDLRRVQDAIKAANRDITELFDTRLAETLFPGRVARQTENFLDVEVKPVLEFMAKNGVTQAELSDYMLARHAPERNAQIARVNDDLQDGGAGTNSQGVLMTTQAANDHIAALPAPKRTMLEMAAKRVDEITKGTRDLLVSSGLESQSTVDAWTSVYKNYVPLFKDEAMETPSHPIGSGMSVTGKTTKRATGSTGEVTNMLAHVLMQRESAITRAEKNKVAMSLYGLALTNPNSEMWTTIRPSMPTDQIEQELQRMGVDPVEAQAGMQGVPTIRGVDPVSGKVIDRPNPMYKRLDNALVVKVAGEDRVILFNASNPRAVRLVQNLKGQDRLLGNVDLAGSIVGKATRYFASINTQYNPAFGMVNVVRDVGGALVNLTDTQLAGQQAKILGNTPAAMTGIARDLRGDPQRTPWSDLWTQFQDDGGRTGYRDLFADPYKRAEAVQAELDKLIKAGKLTPGAAAHAVLDFLDDFNTTLENGVRLSAYKAALDDGMSRPQAARLARELTLDFNRKGRLGRELGPLYAFFNASIQGTARTLQAIKGPAGKKIVVGGLALGVIQALMLAAAGFEDDEIPDFIKARAFIIPLPGKQYIAIPLQFGLNALPNTGRVITELLMNGGKDWAEKSFNAIGELAGSFNPLGGGNIFTAHGALATVSPTILDPVVDMATNTNFAGTPISKERMPWDTRPGFTLGRESTQRAPTGQAYIGISKAINSISGGNDFKKGLASPTPEDIKYVFNTMGGGVYRELEKAFNASALMAQGQTLKAREVPLGGRFAGEVEDQDLQRSRFFKNTKKIDTLEAEYKGFAKAGRKDEAAALLKKEPLAKLYEMNDDIRRSIAELNKLAAMKIDDKETLKKIDERRNKLYTILNERVRKMEKESEKKAKE